MSAGELPGKRYRDEAQAHDQRTPYAALLLESATRSRHVRVPSGARVLYVRTDSGCGFTRVETEDAGALVARGYEEARRFFYGKT